MTAPERVKATIWHNPRCGTSRSAQALLQEAGAEVIVIDYLAAPPAREELQRLYERAGMSPREGLRRKEPAAADLGDADDAAVLDAMAANPILIERPLVETDKGAVLARPAEKVHQIL